MLQFPAILLAVLTGFISSLLLSIPVGPVNLTIINEGARRGCQWALLISLGATVMEVIYCFIAFTGFASFFMRDYIKQGMEVFSFFFMLYLGIRFLMAKSAGHPVEFGAAAHRFEERIEERLHPHSAFMTGFVRVMANVGVLVFWIFLAANFILRGWVRPEWPSKLACIAGVAAGTGLWFFILSYRASRGYGKFSEKTLLRLERGSGVALIALALIHGILIIFEIKKHHPQS